MDYVADGANKEPALNSTHITEIRTESSEEGAQNFMTKAVLVLDFLLSSSSQALDFVPPVVVDFAGFQCWP